MNNNLQFSTGNVDIKNKNNCNPDTKTNMDGGLKFSNIDKENL